MSLFQFQEWFSATQQNSFSLAVAKIIGERDQIIVGSLDGILTVFDPGREPNHQNEMGVLSTLQIGRPILQLSTGYFLPSYGPEKIIIVALTPSTLIYFKINQNSYFGRGNVEQICVQSLQGGLILYEAENRVLQRSIPDILHPGPLGKSSENKLIQQQTTLAISTIIGTAGKTLLFYSDTKLIWNVQLPFAAQIVETCTFSDSLRSMIVLLSENSDKLLVGYLGTEPSLFKMPASETLYSFNLFCHENTVLNNKIQILLIIEGEYNLIELFIPLFLICREVPPQRQAIFKLSIDSTQPALDIDILFPEFSNQKEEIGKEISNQNNIVEGKRTSIALQPFFGEPNTSVSLFISTKTNRYRIQSDNTDFVFVIFSVLIERIQKNQPEARLHCPVPLHLCLTEIAKYIEAEEECANLEKQASILATQIRQVETVFLSRLKASQNENIMENHERMPVESLVEYSHKELMKTLDQLNSISQSQLNTKKRKSLGSLLNLMNSTLKLNGIQLPFDGRILEGSDLALIKSEEFMEFVELQSGSLQQDGKLDDL
uniref:Uncharacterized protein n=1 Tax=Meloidogyne javanica TaxID=6303 RepID=A0A915N159_MELJA